ncbi:MATE family efflux transporter [Gorillibacterium massiliense]|uniref:MATE family efflux transporter n=1 Tax=Gorillibacterium massiliense TaxID=1280390 RepID=UPI001EE269C3|nr:MATE family efflux transporter [Gorillibacterium massiliense]
MSVMLYSLYALVNTFFVALGVGPYAAGAVSLSAPMILIIGAFASTVGAGGASIISRSLGKNDTEKAASTAANTFMLFWIIALVFSIIGLLFLDPLLKMMAVDAILMPYAKSYTSIILMGAVSATGFSSLIRAEGNIRYSIYQWAVPSLVNLALDPLFIFVFHMGVEGAALATIVAQIVSTCLSMYYFFLSKFHTYPIRRRHFRIKPALMGEIVVIGSPTLLTQFCQSGLLVSINHKLGTFGGPDAISAFAIISRLKSFLFTPISGIVQGLQPILGFNYAANCQKRVKEAMQVAILASISYGVVIMLICEVIPGQLIRIFIADKQIVTIGITALRAIALSFPFMGVLTLASAYFQSTGKSAVAIALPTMSVLLISLPTLYILSGLFALPGVWFTYLVSDAIMFMVSTAFLRSSLKKLHAEGIGASII